MRVHLSIFGGQECPRSQGLSLCRAHGLVRYLSDMTRREEYEIIKSIVLVELFPVCTGNQELFYKNRL